MSNKIFDALFREQVNVFRGAFSSVSTEVFYEPELKRLRHSGEYGIYRESIVRDFLKFIVPRGLDISSGFVITSKNDISTQCDILICDTRMTPLYQEGGRQRFFPIESLFCIGEVKSRLSRVDLRIAINKLAKVKALGERVTHPAFIHGRPSTSFDPVNNPYDLVPSVLICQKLEVDLDTIVDEIDSLYDSDVDHRHKHNLVLSIEDGLLCYVDKSGLSLPYPRIVRADLKHRFVTPGKNNYVHFNLFGSYMFMLTASKSLLYPEFSDYMGPLDGGFNRDQV